MAAYNEVQYIKMVGDLGATPEGSHLNEVEHAWLTLQGVPEGGHLNERWYTLFATPGVHWNEAAHAWLTLQGIPEGYHLNERFYFYWAGGSPVPPSPPELVALGDGWKRTAFNEWTWAAGGFVQFPSLDFGTVKAGVQYRTTGTVDVFTGTGRVAVRIGSNLADAGSITAVGAFDFTATAGADNLLLRFIIDDNVTMTSFRVRNITLAPNPGGQIVTPDLTLTAGDNGGSRVGFRAGSYGAVAPDQLVNGDPILALFCNNNNGRVRFKVGGEHPADAFTSMEIVGQGTLLAADATYDYDGAETEWSWMSTGFNLTSGATYAVTFL